MTLDTKTITATPTPITLAPTRVGEVIDATTTEFTAQSYTLHESPYFGSFVRASNGSAEVWAVVAQAHTAGIDPGRLPVARGADAADEAEIYDRNPELPQLLRTHFTALVVGYRDGNGAGVVRHQLPPRPPRVHAFVHGATEAEVAEFTAELGYIDASLRLQTAAPVDELVSAAIRAAAAARRGQGEGEAYAYRLRCARHLARLLGREPARLVAMLQRVRE